MLRKSVSNAKPLSKAAQNTNLIRSYLPSTVREGPSTEKKEEPVDPISTSPKKGAYGSSVSRET